MTYRDLFENLNDEEITYVVSRRYGDLPEDTIHGDGDVDLVVDPQQFESAMDVCERTGFSTATISRRRLYRRAMRNPTNAARRVVQAPKQSVKKAIAGDTERTGNPRHRYVHLYREDQMVDLQSNLAYTSPMNGSKVPVDLSVTNGMLTRRRPKDCFYVPTSADELAHLVPHCVFDKAGEFSPYYVDRCDELLDEVRSDVEQYRLLERLLGDVFYGADEMVLQLISNGRYADLRSELERFADY